MKRNIIEIDENLCNGCGECITACAEGALELIDGKARLVSDVYCDGLGACLSGCPTGALQVIERDADEFSEEAVKERERGEGSKEQGVRSNGGPTFLSGKTGDKNVAPPQSADTLPCGCPGSAVIDLKRPAVGGCPGSAAMTMKGSSATDAATGVGAGAAGATGADGSVSELGHWPVKLELIRPDAPFLRGADMILLADCGGVTIPDLHRRFLKGRVVAIACPKFGDLDSHLERLTALLTSGGVASLTVVHMEVPCCRGLVMAAERALQRAGVDIELKRIKVGRDGRALEEEILHPPASKAASK